MRNNEGDDEHANDEGDDEHANEGGDDESGYGHTCPDSRVLLSADGRSVHLR